MTTASYFYSYSAPPKTSSTSATLALIPTTAAYANPHRCSQNYLAPQPPTMPTPVQPPKHCYCGIHYSHSPPPPLAPTATHADSATTPYGRPPPRVLKDSATLWTPGVPADSQPFQTPNPPCHCTACGAALSAPAEQFLQQRLGLRLPEPLRPPMNATPSGFPVTA